MHCPRERKKTTKWTRFLSILPKFHRCGRKETSDVVPTARWSDANAAQRRISAMSVGVRYNWPTAGVCAAFHPRIDFTPSLCPSLTTPLCNNNHQPTNQPYSILSYTILSYPILSCPSLRRATKLLALSNLSPCFSISLERTARVHIRSSHSRTPFAHEAHERAGTKNECGTSEREAREGVGGEGGGAHKGR